MLLSPNMAEGLLFYILRHWLSAKNVPTWMIQSLSTSKEIQSLAVELAPCLPRMLTFQEILCQPLLCCHHHPA